MFDLVNLVMDSIGNPSRINAMQSANDRCNGFLEILSISLHLYLVLHTKWLFHMPWLSMISFILSSHGFQSESMKRKNLKKPYLYRLGIDKVFWKFAS